MLSSNAFAPPRADINVTPLVDVVLVLLIIFMVITPLLQVRFPVSLPRASSAASPAQRLVTVTLDAQGALTLNGAPTPLSALESRLAELFALGAERQVLFEGADQATHKEAMDVMDRIRRVRGSVGASGSRFRNVMTRGSVVRPCLNGAGN